MKTVKIITTNEKKNQFWKEEVKEWEKKSAAMNVVNVYPEVTYQKVHGFGGAFTEASAHIYQQMSEEKKQAVINDYFSQEGLCYNFGRVHMNSCDFALGNYTYIKDGDAKLETFDIAHDFNEIIPMIMDAMEVSKEPIQFLMSPWSPPAFMKTNGEMNHGGKLKEQYYGAWAQYFVKFIKAYDEAGIHLTYLTVQNEPEAVQTWDSCVYTAKEEGDFVREYLAPALEKAGLSYVKIFVWDHNKENAYDRFKETVENEQTKCKVAGAAIHWYTGDHFEAIEMIRKQFPGKEVLFTEGCVEYSRFADSGEVQKAEMYAHDMLGNLNAGVSGIIDWNLVLDHKGGPNHVGNFCAAPIMCNVETDEYEKRLPYYYIGQFSRYIRPEAVRIGTSRYTDKLEVTGFLNPDGERVVVVLNKSDEQMPLVLRESGEVIEMKMEAHSVSTFCY